MTQEESFFCQSLATCHLFIALNENKLLDSDFYKKLCLLRDDDFSKSVLHKSGLGNPAMLQTMFYLLLVCPREIFNHTYKDDEEKLKNEFNKKASSLATEIDTSYKGENKSKPETINDFNHIRNAISHASCRYYSNKQGINYVTFYDKNPKDPKQHCSLTFTTANAGKLLHFLDNQMIQWINNKFVPKFSLK